MNLLTNNINDISKVLNITSYDNIMYNSRPSSYNEFITDKYNKVHIELFNDAIRKYYNNEIIDKNITSDFIYNFLQILSNTNNNFEEFYNKFLNSDLGKSELKLHIDTYEYCNIMFNKILNYINEIKLKIINENINLINKETDETIGLNNVSDIDDFIIIYVNNCTYLNAERNNNEDENNSENWGDEFVSYIVSSNSIKRYKFFKSELNNYVILLETENGIRIGYNKYGEFILILDSFKFASDETSQLKRISIIRYINSINIKLKNDFKNVLLNIYKKNNRIIEIKDNEYWKPSNILIVSKIKPFNKVIKSLEPYWNNIQSMETYNIEDIKLTKDKITDAEIVELNYIQGMAKLRSKSLDMEFNVPFKYLNEYVEVNEELNLSNIIS